MWIFLGLATAVIVAVPEAVHIHEVHPNHGPEVNLVIVSATHVHQLQQDPVQAVVIR